MLLAAAIIGVHNIFLHTGFHADRLLYQAPARKKLMRYIEYVINTSEAAWKYYDQGIINEEEAGYFTQGLCRLVDLDPSLVAAWRENEQNRIPGFYEYVTKLCEL